MACLQRGILPIIRKTQELGRNILLRHFTQMANGRQTEDRLRRAAPLRTEHRQLAEILTLARVVGDTSMQAEAEWRGNKMPQQTISCRVWAAIALAKCPIGIDPQGHR